jgi:peptidoglycan/LPS O-acetylase OafA/YrhL
MVHHTEQLRYFYGVPHLWFNGIIRNLGQLGVLLFFVLSGFLITSLLLKEKEVSGTIKVRDFYMRRVLRIWPLYYLIVVAALFLIPLITWMTWPGFERAIIWKDLGWRFLLFVLLLPNVSVNVFGLVPFAGQAWSIGAEEQFYLIWPVLMKKVRNKWVLVLGTILLYVIMIYVFLGFQIDKKTGFLNIVYNFWVTSPFESLAIGAAYALIVNTKSGFVLRLKNLLFNKWLQWLVLLVTVYIVARGIPLSFPRYVGCAVLFGFSISNLAANPKRIINLEWAPVSYLGKISYGLYMYHLLAITIVLKVFLSLHYTGRLFLYPLVFLLTIILASLSYRYFEKPFLKRKIKYSKILSGDEIAKN